MKTTIIISAVLAVLVSAAPADDLRPNSAARLTSSNALAARDAVALPEMKRSINGIIARSDGRGDGPGGKYKDQPNKGNKDQPNKVNKSKYVKSTATDKHDTSTSEDERQKGNSGRLGGAGDSAGDDHGMKDVPNRKVRRSARQVKRATRIHSQSRP